MTTDTHTSTSPLARAARATRLAFAFLTVLPLKFRDDETTADDLAASRFAYPVVGAVIGLLLALFSELLNRGGAPSGVSAFLLVAAGVLISGGLHLDGLADSFDGLFLWGDAERRLTVMRDPHVGSFGVSALVLVLLGKYATLSALAGSGRAWAILGAALVSRTLILVSAGTARYARPDGTGRIVVEATTARDAWAAAALALVFGAAVRGGPGLLAAATALGIAGIWTRLVRNRIGGVTGDTLGALVELGELGFLMVLGLARY